MRRGLIVSKVKPLIAAAWLLASPAVYALDGVSLEYGHSDSSNVNVNLYRVGVQWDWNKKLIEMGSWNLGGYWDSSFGYWANNSFARTTANIVDIGLTPVFRLQPNNTAGFSPFVEAGVGIHFLSHTSLNYQRQFGSSFEFGDHVGAGFRFGNKGQYEIGYRYQHLSNAGIKKPNQGVNYNQLRLEYHF